MASASLQAFRRVVTVSWPAHMEKGAKEHLLRVARNGHARIMADATRVAGYPPQWEAYANRPGNANLESVILPGPIVYRYRYFNTIAEVALTALQRLSPVRSGLYAKSHTIYVNGAPVARAPRTMTQEIMISNPVPYARKLEIGKTKSGRAFLVQVPNRIYERVARALQSRYRNVANITFTYARIAGHDRWPAIIIGPPRAR